MQEIAPRVVVDAAVQGGRPVIKGTRIPVEVLVGQMAAGLTQDEVCREYGVNREDVLAALAYATQTLAQEHVHAIS